MEVVLRDGSGKRQKRVMTTPIFRLPDGTEFTGRRIGLELRTQISKSGKIERHPMKTGFVEHLARALQRVVGDHLRRSGHGEVWRDERTWIEMSSELIVTLSSAVVLTGRERYNELLREATQMKRIRQHVEEYSARGNKQQRNDAEKNPYTRWANENMPKEPKP